MGWAKVTLGAIATSFAACSGAYGTPLANTGTGGALSLLHGDLSFAPNAVLVGIRSRSDGGIDTSSTDITMASSTPPFACEFVAANLPDSGVIRDLLDIDLRAITTDAISIGTYFISSSRDESATDGGVIVLLFLYGPSSSLPSTPEEIAAGVSGTITLTQVGATYSGFFSASVLLIPDGGESVLSGSFDTSLVCGRPE